ncbi:Carboxyl-terminal protease [Candidatus Sulfopaludibacter sp. SbA4]|nr:Carboxyl-terminal protease [Candidatus Sulfopaludibacter sp. SbA4]
MSSRIKYFIVSASTCLTLLLVVGGVLGQGASNADDTLKHIGVFSDVVAHIKSEYVEEPDMKSVTLGALNGLLEAIDPFASYLNADQYKEYLKNKDLKRADIGLMLSKKFGYVGVVGAVPNSPAAKAGFTTGDMIESIKGVATRDMPLAYATMLMQGDPGSSVELSVVRVRQPEPQTVKLTRANVSLPSVESKMLAGQVGYVNIDALSPALVKEVAAAITKLQKDGAQKLVIDVRNCFTGSPEDGIAMANLFLTKGHIAYMQGQRVPRQNFDADPGKAITSLPTAVLTNRGTADAAEIVAAALMDNNRAQVVGERTYGDAAQRKAITMDDGSAIILSVAKYYSPNGKAIQDTGVTPGTQAAEAEVQVDYDDNGEPIPLTPEQLQQQQKKKMEDDPVVKKALEVLSSKA